MAQRRRSKVFLISNLAWHEGRAAVMLPDDADRHQVGGREFDAFMMSANPVQLGCIS